MSCHAAKCAFAYMAKGIKEMSPVTPPNLDEAKARWNGVTWRLHGDEELESQLNGVADLAAALEERRADHDSMQMIINEAKERIKTWKEGSEAGRRSLAPLMSDPDEDVSNNAFMAFLDAFAD